MRRKRLLPVLRRHRKVLILLFLLVVLALLVHGARQVDWPAVLKAVRTIPPQTIALALAATAAGYLAYAAMDLLSQRYTGHGLPRWRVMAIAMLSYALNLNLGVLIGGLGTRLRLYTRLGCRQSVATRVTLFSALSNWLGFAWLAGALLLAGAVPMPDWMQGSRLAGASMLVLAALYSGACWRHPGKRWHWRRWTIVLPGLRMAGAQSLVAMLSWSLMGLTVYLLLQQRVPYPAALGILMFSSVAALITRIPGGLGTTEAVFVGALAGRLAPAEVLAAILPYRAVYFLLPLMLALIGFGITEARLGWRARRG